MIKLRDFRRCDHLGLSQTLNHRLNLRDIDIDSLDPSELASFFLTSVIDSLNKFAPFTTRKLYRPKNPWLISELKLEVRHRDAVYKKARRTRDSSLLSLYRNLRSEFK